MRNFFSAALSWLHQVALSLWLGGILIIGAVTAPAVFGTAKSQGQTDASQPLYRFAGEAMGEVFRRFNYVVIVAGVLLLLTGIAYGALSGACRKRLTVRALLTGAALGFGVWVTFVLYPQMVAARAAGVGADFDAMHRTYSMAFQAQLVLLLGVAALTAWMHRPGDVGREVKREDLKREDVGRERVVQP